MSDVLLSTPTQEHTIAGQLVKIYIHQLFAGAGYCLEDLTDQQGQMVKEKRNLCYRHALMMIIIGLCLIEYIYLNQHVNAIS